MSATDNHPIIKQAWPDLDPVIQFMSNERGVWAGCKLCGAGLRGWPSVGPTAVNARQHLEDFHPGWNAPAEDHPEPDGSETGDDRG